MTNQQHSITPPPKRFKQWEDDILNERDNVDYVLDCAWRDGFQAGADQELKACCEWIGSEGLAGYTSRELRAARRPKPPSLKEQALESLHHLEAGCAPNVDLLRRALEQLDD